MIRKFGFELEVFVSCFELIFLGLVLGFDLVVWSIPNYGKSHFECLIGIQKNVKNQLLDRPLLFIKIYCLSTFSICSVQR